MSEPIHLLLVEDNPGDADLVREILGAGDTKCFEIEDADRLAAAMRSTEQDSYDVVLLDLGLPDSAGLDTLRAMRARVPDTPIVVITGNSEQSTGIAAIKEGAHDFVVKGEMTGAYLARVLQYACERHQMLHRLQESEEQLHQSQKMEALGQLAGGIAHDFNNLLTAIMGYSELLLIRPELSSGSAGKEIAEIRRAADRAAALTRQILAFSRRQTLRPRTVILNEVLAGLESLLLRTLGEDINLISVRDPDAGAVEVDVHKFEQALLNLVVNARDALQPGGHLTLETENVELDEEYCCVHQEVSPGEYVMLAVTDDGMGMDEVTVARIFEPFFTTKPPGQGTGLGLATVYGTVKQSGGSISVYSEVGKGTCFKIYLPRVGATAETETQPETSKGDHAPAGGRETILIVEDESSIRELSSRVLGSLGYRVLAAGTAQEALQVFEDSGHVVDLVLTDLVLPGGMQGGDLVTQLLSRAPGVKVLYMSGYTRNAIVHSGRLDRGVCFLEKPFTPGELALALRQTLDGECP